MRSGIPTPAVKRPALSMPKLWWAAQDRGLPLPGVITTTARVIGAAPARGRSPSFVPRRGSGINRRQQQRRRHGHGLSLPFALVTIRHRRCRHLPHSRRCSPAAAGDACHGPGAKARQRGRQLERQRGRPGAALPLQQRRRTAPGAPSRCRCSRPKPSLPFLVSVSSPLPL